MTCKILLQPFVDTKTNVLRLLLPARIPLGGSAYQLGHRRSPDTHPRHRVPYSDHEGGLTFAMDDAAAVHGRISHWLIGGGEGTDQGKNAQGGVASVHGVSWLARKKDCYGNLETCTWITGCVCRSEEIEDMRCYQLTPARCNQE
jgi:hypothetical protein